MALDVLSLRIKAVLAWFKKPAEAPKIPQKPQRKNMTPISYERRDWCEARIFLLGRMIRELTTRQTRYQSNPRYGRFHSPVMDAMLAEQLQLNIERNCIEEYLEGEARANEARAGALGLSNGS